MNTLSRPSQVFFSIAILGAIAYFLRPFADGSLLLIATKATCCIALAVVAFQSVSDARQKKLTVLALLFSCLGDIFLAITSADYFVQGLGSFLIAHLLYICVFVRARLTPPLSPLRTALIGIIFLFAAGMMWLLWPTLGELKAPVFVYISVIGLMAVAALYSQFSPTLAVTGAISFLISDATIAVDKFLVPFDLASPLIWITYAGAQILLTLAIIKGPRTKKMPA